MTRKVLLNPCFREINEFKGRYRVLKGSAGAGKSHNVATDLVLKLMSPEFKGANLLCVRKTFEANLFSTFPELIGAIMRICGERSGEIWEINKSVPRLKCKTTGNQVIFRGLYDEAQRERLKSIGLPEGKLTWIWVEEASEILPGDIEMLDDRLRGELEKGLFYQITLTFNPIFRAAWLKERFFEVIDPEIMVSHTTFRDNLFIDRGFKKRMAERKRRDPEGYRVYGEGEWGTFEGQIFPNAEVKDFSRELLWYDSLSMGQDFGFNHANVIILAGIKDGDVYIIRELYERGRDTGELIGLADRMGFPKDIPMHCDSAEPDRIRMWQKAGYRAFGCKKYPGSVLGAITWLKGRRIFIHPGCPNAARELKGYMWQRDKDGRFIDIPQGYDDDAAAALRYGCEFWIKAAEGGGERGGEAKERGGPRKYREFLTGGAPAESYLRF